MSRDNYPASRFVLQHSTLEGCSCSWSQLPYRAPVVVAHGQALLRSLLGCHVQPKPTLPDPTSEPRRARSG